MELPDEMKEALEPAVRYVFHAMRASEPPNSIVEMLRFKTLREEEIEWVMIEGARRFAPYKQMLAKEDQAEGRWTMAICGALAFGAAAFIYFWGIPDNPRSGRIWLALLVGGGGALYGLYLFVRGWSVSQSGKRNGGGN